MLLDKLLFQLVVLPIWNVELITPKPIRGYPKNDNKSLGAALKRERLVRAWTQEETAEYLDLIPSNYMRFEHNIHVPDIYKRKRINCFLKFNYWDDGTDRLANRLLLYRIGLQLSVFDCAELIGVSRNTIKRIELSVKTSLEIMSLVQNYIIKNP